MNVVRSIALDPIEPRRYLWLGFAGGGLDKFEMQSGKCRHLGENQGLPDMTVYGILTDADDNLWMSTNHGLAVMNSQTETIKSFTKEDGLLDNEFNASAYWNTSDGVMLFGGIRGFNRFRPESVNHANTHIPGIAFTGFRISNKPVRLRQSDFPYTKSVTYAQQIKIPARFKSFSIEYSALDFYAPEQNQYRYRLDGFDPDWQYAGNARSATYTNLDPGTYTFHVIASNNDGIWNTEGISLQVVILPPWYKTWWAYLIYAAAIGGILYFIRKKELYEQRLRHELDIEHIEAEKLKEVDQLKSRFFANISHEFRTPLTLILGHLENAGSAPLDARTKNGLRAATRNGKKLLQLINQLLDLSKIDAGRMQLHRRQQDVIPFLKHILNSFESAAERHAIGLSFKSKEEQVRFAFDADKLERVFINLLSNALKFTPDGGQIELLVETEPSDPHASDDKVLIIKVRDTGAGIPEEALPHVFDRFYQSENQTALNTEGTGIGLALVRELIELHGGDVAVVSAKGKGSTFTIRVPLVQQ
jgi:signal transduction histidine kinase